MEEHLSRLLPDLETETARAGSAEPGGNGNGAAEPAAPPGPGGIGEGGEEEGLQMEIGEDSLAQTEGFTGPGGFIRTPNPMDLGEEFPLKLHLSGSAEPLNVLCRVIWTNKYGKESRHLHRGMGVKFLNLAPGAQKRLDDFLNARQSQGLFIAGRGFSAEG